MAQLRPALILIASGFISFVALAADAVPIVNYENLPVLTGTGNAASVQAVAVAISHAAASGKRVWGVKRAASGRLRATYNMRQHAISVDIDYSDKAYSIRYAASDNMKFGEMNGQKVIDPFYNTWVDELKRGINAQLSKL